MGLKPPVALTIAGSDSGGGAGIVADLKTFEAHGVWGTCAIAAVTAQNTLGVIGFSPVAAELVRQQVEAVARDIGVQAAKTGMLASADNVAAVADAFDELDELADVPLIVDPVLVASSGEALLADDALDVLRKRLLPRATVATPNLAEAARLLDCDVPTDRDQMVEAAARLATLGPAVVLLKGGHLAGDGAHSPDLVYRADGRFEWLEGERLGVRHTHGTGCVLSAALTAELARGMDPTDACVASKQFVTHAIAFGVPLGTGTGPVNPGWERLA